MENRIKELRELASISQRKLAKSVGISQQAIANYETGERTPRNEEIWKKMANYFNVPVSYIKGYGKDLTEIKNYIYDLISDYGCGFQSDNLLPEEIVNQFQNAIDLYCRHISTDVKDVDDLYDFAYTNDEIDYPKRNRNFDKIFKNVFTDKFLISLSTYVNKLDDIAILLLIVTKLNNFSAQLVQNEEKKAEKKRLKELNIDTKKVKKIILQKEMDLTYNLDHGSKNEIKNSINKLIDILQNILNKI